MGGHSSYFSWHYVPNWRNISNVPLKTHLGHKLVLWFQKNDTFLFCWYIDVKVIDFSLRHDVVEVLFDCRELFEGHIGAHTRLCMRTLRVQNWFFIFFAIVHCRRLLIGLTYVLVFQKLNDNREKVIKRRKKKEVNSVEEKNPKKNKVPKQGWESWQYYIHHHKLGKLEMKRVLTFTLDWNVSSANTHAKY